MGHLHPRGDVQRKAMHCDPPAQSCSARAEPRAGSSFLGKRTDAAAEPARPHTDRRDLLPVNPHARQAVLDPSLHPKVAERADEHLLDAAEVPRDVLRVPREVQNRVADLCAQRPTASGFSAVVSVPGRKSPRLSALDGRVGGHGACQLPGRVVRNLPAALHPAREDRGRQPRSGCM